MKIINHSFQAFLHSRATGTAMAMIGKSVLDALEVPVPGLARQKNRRPRRIVRQAAEVNDATGNRI